MRAAPRARMEPGQRTSRLLGLHDIAAWRIAATGVWPVLIAARNELIGLVSAPSSRIAAEEVRQSGLPTYTNAAQK